MYRHLLCSWCSPSFKPLCLFLFSHQVVSDSADPWIAECQASMSLTMNPMNLGAAAAAKSLQSCPTLCDPIEGSPPGSPIPGILQARTLEWVAISFSRTSVLVRHKSILHPGLLKFGRCVPSQQELVFS